MRGDRHALFQKSASWCSVLANSDLHCKTQVHPGKDGAAPPRFDRYGSLLLSTDLLAITNCSEKRAAGGCPKTERSTEQELLTCSARDTRRLHQTRILLLFRCVLINIWAHVYIYNICIIYIHIYKLYTLIYIYIYIHNTYIYIYISGVRNGTGLQGTGAGAPSRSSRAAWRCWSPSTTPSTPRRCSQHHLNSKQKQTMPYVIVYLYSRSRKSKQQQNTA